MTCTKIDIDRMHTRELLVIATIFSLTVMVGIGTSAMPPALAAVQHHFDISPDRAGLLLSVFTLPGLLLAPLLGYLADRLGRRVVLVISLCIFALAGAAALVVTTFDQLIVVRLIQGIGAASLGALNVTLLSDFFTGSRRVQLIGFNHSVLSIGTAVIPVLSGILSTINWRLPFALPLLGIIVIAGIVGAIPPLERHEKKRGSDAQGLKWRAISVVLTVSVISYAVLFGPFLNYLQEQIRLLDPNSPALYQRIGLMVGFMSVVTTVGALFVGRLSRRYKLPRLLVLSCMLYAISVGLMGWMPSYLLLFVPTALFGIAQALNQPIVQSLAAAIAPIRLRGTVLSLNRSAALIGQTVGPLFFGIIYRTSGLDGVFTVGAVLALICAAIVWGDTSLPRSIDLDQD